MTSLFQKKRDSHDIPLAYQLAPKSFDRYVGQSHIVGKNAPLRALLKQGVWGSLIFWGPPGIGKTALSRLIANMSQSSYVKINAVTASIKDIRGAIEKASQNRTYGKKTVLFIDEIHRFNKTQQDALLDAVETGLLSLIGATTENPSFSVNASLVSRAHVYELYPLEDNELRQILKNAFEMLGIQRKISVEVEAYLIKQSIGDARRLLNKLELCLAYIQEKSLKKIELKQVQVLLDNPTGHYDKQVHYDIISAFIKSMRGSSPDAALYWLLKLVSIGEDPLFIARRLIIFASEDIGNADPVALQVAVSAYHALQAVGLPEAEYNLSQATLYLATAPKSNATTIALKRVKKLIEEGSHYQVPGHLRDTHGPGRERDAYLYPHDFEYGIVKQIYLPEKKCFYEPVERGHEKLIKKRMSFVQAIQDKP